MVQSFNKKAALKPILYGLLLVVVFHLITVSIGLAPDFAGNNWYLNWDTDSYSRILGILKLYQSGTWFDHSAPYFNAPYGIDMHWTRALDILLLPGAWVGSWLGDVKNYLELWAVLLTGPIAHLSFVPVLYWICIRFTNHSGFILLVLMFLSSVAISHTHLLGFIDYHGLLALILLLSLGMLIRGAGKNEKDESTFLILGMLAAFSVWLSVEGLLLSLPVLIAMGILWLRGNQSYLEKTQTYCFSLLSFLLLFLLVERPLSEWGVIETDRLSILHIIVAATMWLGCLLLGLLQRRGHLRSSKQRLMFAVLVVLMGLWGLHFFFPALLGHPQQDIGEIAEFLLDGQRGERPYFAVNRYPSIIFLELGPALITLPYLFYVLFTANGERQKRFLIYAVFVLFFIAYLLFKQRAILFYQVAILLPWFETILGVWGKIKDKTGLLPLPTKMMINLILVVLIFVHYIPYGYAKYQRQQNSVILTATPLCDYDEVLPYLTDPIEKRKALSILAPLFAGPELVYKSGYSVIGSPYHRNRQGIEDGFFLGWENSHHPGIGKLVKYRRVRYILACKSYFHNKQQAIQQNPNSLYARLLKNNPPSWLTKVKLPEPIEKRYILYRKQ